MTAPRVAVIGAGQVGATTAQRLAEQGTADVILFDVAEGLAQGKALDLMQAEPVEAHGRSITGTSEIRDIAGSGIVVVTAGMPRKPGMSREDLLSANAKIMRSVCEGLKRHTPRAVVIIVTNPLDIMTDFAARLLGFPRSRVMGMAGVLDSCRMRYFVSRELGVAPHRIEATVLGGHGDLMVPVMSRILLDGKPVRNLGQQKQKDIVERTQRGGAEIVKLLKTGSAFYAPATSVALMVRAVLEDKGDVLPVCAYCRGEYGIENGYFGVTAKLGREGVAEVVQIPLSDDELAMLQKSAEKVRRGIEELSAIV